MQAIENAPPDHRTATAFIERCRQQGRLRTFTPAPLGEQRERFCALAQELRRRGDAYISQLSMLTLAGLGRRDTSEPSHAILSSLLHGAGIREHEQTELMLWQSRVMIELGEAYDIEQVELHNALDAIARRQNSLFAELREEEEPPFVLPVAGQEDSPETENILRHRLRAWTRLCFHGGAPAPGLLVSRHPAAIDLLQEVYERRWGQSARLLASFEIPAPARTETDDEPPGQKCPNLDRLLTKIAAAGSFLRLSGEDEPLLREGKEEWLRVTASPAASPPAEPAMLDLFYFPQARPAQLFAESFADAVSGQADSGKEDAGCVVGLLRTS